MKRVLVLFAILICSVNLYAQSTRRIGTTQGTLIERVKVVEIVPEVSEEPEEPEKEVETIDSKIGVQKELSLGMWKLFDAGELCAYKINYIYGKRLDDYFFIGGGVGLEYDANSGSYDDIIYQEHSGWYTMPAVDSYGEDHLYMPLSTLVVPLFVNAKAYLTNTKVSPYFSASTGFRLASKQTIKVDNYSAPDEWVEYGGTSPFFEIAMGFTLRDSKDNQYNIQLGCFGATLDAFEWGYKTWEIYKDYWTRCYSLSLGVVF